MTDKPRHRRLRISLRAFMLLVLVFAVWLGMQVNKARQQRAAVDAVKKHGGQVHYDYEYVNGELVMGNPWGPSWLRRRLGNEYFQNVVEVSLYHDSSNRTDCNDCDEVFSRLSSQNSLKSLKVAGGHATNKGFDRLSSLTQLQELYLWQSQDISDEEIRSIRGLENLECLHIYGSRITDRRLLTLVGMTKLKWLALDSHCFTDRGLSAIAGMKDLRWLNMNGSEDSPSHITNASLAVFAGMKNLEELSLSHSRVTDEGLVHLKGLTKLQILDLEECKVGNEGLRHLSGLTNLKWLTLYGTEVGDEGLKYVRDLPRLELLRLKGSKVSEKAKRELRKARPTLDLG